MAIIRKKYIGLLGGSFDPAHKGHLGISKIAIKKLKLKKIYWVITKKNPFKNETFYSLEERIKYAKKINLETLVEFHSKENLEIVVDSSPSLVGVNCRNLKTMQTDIKYFSEIAGLLPDQLIKVAESGINTRDDLSYVADQGYDAALIGTSLMKTKNPGKALEKLLRG